MAGRGQDSRAYVTSAAITFPLTITAASNDQFEYNEVEYIIPAGVYATADALATAVNKSVVDEDFTTSPKFSTLVSVVREPGTTNKLRFVSVPVGVNTLAFGTGAEHDGLASLGLTDAWTIAHAVAGSDGGANSGQGTLYSSSVYWNGFEYASNELQAHLG